MLSKRPEVAQYDLSRLKDILGSATPLSKELQNHMAKRFNKSGLGDDRGDLCRVDYAGWY